MKNKFKSLFLAAALSIQGLSGVAYATEENWSITLNGENQNVERYMGEINDSYSYEGDRSVYFKYSIGTVDETEYLEIKNTLKTNPTAGSYTLKFYYKGHVSNTTKVMLGNTSLVFSDFTATPIEISPSGENGWTEYSADITITESADDLSFRVYSGIPYSKYAAIDMVSLIAEGTTRNLVLNPGFEDVPPIMEQYDTTDYQPVNFMIRPIKNGLGLNWTNPKTAELTDVKIYDITSGEEILLPDDISATPGGTVLHKITDLTNGEYYQYKVVFSYETKPDRIYWLGGTPKSVEDITVGGGGIWLYSAGGSGWVPAGGGVDLTESYAGEGSLKIQSNLDTTIAGFQRDTKVTYRRWVEMSADAYYKLSFYAKSKNVEAVPSTHVNWMSWEDGKSTLSELKGTTDEWVHIERTLKSTGSQILYIDLIGKCESLWIDELEMWPVNEKGERTGDNIVTEHFDAPSSTEVVDISDVNVVTSSGKAVLSWDVPAGIYAGANVYCKVFDNWEYCGTLAANQVRLSIDGLTNGSSYSYKIIPVNEYMFEGKEKIVDFELPILDYEVMTPSITKEDGTVVKAIRTAGRYIVTVPVKNTYIGEGLEYEQLVVVYKDGTIVNAYSTKAVLDDTSVYASPEKITTSFEISEDGNYAVEIYPINNRTDWDLLSEPGYYY